MKIFDVHTHCFPDPLAERAIDVISKKGNTPSYHNGTLDGLKKYEDNIGTAGFLVLPIATNPSQANSINTFAASINTGNVKSFGSVHPMSEEYEKELDHVERLGLKGIKLHPEYQDFFVDEERFYPFYEAAAKRELIICFHAGEDLGFGPPVHGSPESISKIARAFPYARIMAAHMGGFQRWHEVKKHLAGLENVWLDTSFGAEYMDKWDSYAEATAYPV